MANMGESLRNMSFESTAAKGGTDVTVSAFSNGALKGVLDAISRQSAIITSLEDGLGSLRDTQSKQNNDNRKENRKNSLASDAANRKSRATNAAMYGEIKKGNVFNKMLREGLMSALEGLTGFLKENLNKALKTQADLAATMRRANLTHDQKNQIQDLAISMKGILAGDFAKLDISNAQAKEYISDLIASGKDVTRMRKDELAGYMALRKRNMDADKAYELAKVSSYDSMKNLANSLGDNQIAKSLGNVLSSLDANQRATFGGTDKAIATLTPLVKQLEARAGGVLNSEEVSQIVMAYAAKQNPALTASGKLPQGIETLAAVGGNADSIDKFFDNIIASSSYVTSAGDVLSNFAARAKEAEENGRNIRKELYTDERIKDANETNKSEGKLPSIFEDIFNSTLGKITGPLSNTLDEWFGESVDIAKITGTGFKIVIGLLGSLVAGKFLGGFTGKITSLIGGLGNKLGGPLGKIVGLLGVGSGLVNSGGSFEDFLDIDDINEPDRKKGKSKASRGKGKSKASIGKGKSKASIGKLSKLGKVGSKIAGRAAKVGAKAIPVAGIAIAAADSAVDLYDTFTWEAESLALESSSEAFKKMEAGINQSTKNGKVAAATAGAIGTFGGMAAGAAIGSAVPIVGTAIGTVVGLGVGAITSAIAEGKEALNNTKIYITNVEDLEKGAKELEDALKTEADPLRIEELKKALSQTNRDLDLAKDAQMQDLINKFNDKNGAFAINAAAMDKISSILNNSDKEISALQGQLRDLKTRGGTAREIEMLNSQIEAIQKQSADYRQTLTGLAGGEFKIKDGESLEEVVKRISADIRGDGVFDTREDAEYFAAESRAKVDAFLKKQALDSLTNGVMHDSLDDLRISNVDTIEKFVKASNLGAGMSEEALKDLTKEVIKMAKGEDKAIKWQQEQAKKPVDINIKPNALGGLYNSPTAALIGEDGKEAVLPLEKPGQLFKILNKLTANERVNILTALLSGRSAGNLLSMLIKISDSSTRHALSGLSYIANIGGSIPDDNTETTKKILSFTGPFSGFVSNLLLHDKNDKYKTISKQYKKWYDEVLHNTTIQGSTNLVHSTYTKRDHDQSVMQLDKQLKLKHGSRKDKLKEFPYFRTYDDLTTDTATPYRSAAVTLPKLGEQYVNSELQRLFTPASGKLKLQGGINFGTDYSVNIPTEGESPKLTALVDESLFTNNASLHDFISQFIGTDYQNLQASNVYSELVTDYESAIADIAASSFLEAKRSAIEFSKSALDLLGNKRTSPEILEALNIMIKYLRDIAVSPANKKAVIPVSRPVNVSYS